MSQGSLPVLAQLGRVQYARKIVLAVLTLAALAAVFLVGSAWPADGPARTAIELAGALLILACIAGRTWCSLYVGARKTRELVVIGPYSATRNPLYVMSVLGAAGAGAVFGSLVFAVAAGAVTLAVFSVVVRKEEEVLEATHGQAYRDYRARVPRFFPHFSAWQGADEMVVSLRAVRSTFIDSLFFLVPIPLAMVVEELQKAGWPAVVLRLP